MISTVNIQDQEHRRVITSLSEYANGKRKSVISSANISDMELRKVVQGIAGGGKPSTANIENHETRRVLDSIINHISRRN
jgi:hypothetical protein